MVRGMPPRARAGIVGNSTEECTVRTCHTSGKCYSGALWMGKQVASGNPHRARATASRGDGQTTHERAA